MQEIQELCLEEMLGISKKRLLSIINATKCPTDTESSDSGSDVEKVEEHISLEEISSDSNDELTKPKTKKKRESKKGPLAKKAATSTATAEQNGDNTEKQYSVLELLELQARARAIRSQLALEPVTKIELDDSDVESGAQSQDKDENQNTGTATVPPQSNSKEKEKNVPKQSDAKSKLPTTRPVRLKRNFRQRQTEGYESEDNQSIDEPEKNSQNTEPLKTAEKQQSPEKQKSPAKESEPATVTNDDDVVPIIAEPEVLCISSSDSESDDKSASSKVRKYINIPLVEKVDRPPTEDELFLLKIKEKSEAKSKSDTGKDNKTTDSTSNANNESRNVEQEGNQQAEAGLEKSKEDMEDGEIIEEDEIFEIADSPECPAEESHQTNEAAEDIDKTYTEHVKTVNRIEEMDKNKDDDQSSTSSESADERKRADSGDSANDSDSSEENAVSSASKKSNADDDDDDIIDLGKDEDLDFEQLEMNTAPEEPEKVKSPRRTRSNTKSHKLDEQEKSAEPKDESWDKRWLRGNKVSKVLATAKLANKVRSKIIEKKSRTVAKCKTPEIEEPINPEPEVAPNVELGSVEHYKELTKKK